jgi:hypothetical protein
MKGKILLFSAIMPVLLLGCTTYPRTPTQEGYITAVRGPVNPTAVEEAGKTGEGSSYGILSLVAWGDSSIETACRQGGISKIQNVDYSKIKIVIPHFNVTLYEKYTVKVRGD